VILVVEEIEKKKGLDAISRQHGLNPPPHYSEIAAVNIYKFKIKEKTGKISRLTKKK